MKRFYKEVSLSKGCRGVAVHLDGRPVLTPGRKVLHLPNPELAEAVSREWEQAGDEIDPRLMRLTRLANSAIDRIGDHRESMIGEMTGYIGTDLVCYRAEAPEGLRLRQNNLWDPLVDWVRDRHGITLYVTTSILPREPPAETRDLARTVLDGIGDYALAGLHSATTACGSLVIGLALADAVIDASGAWKASLVDEDWQIEEWGLDPEAEQRRADLLEDIRSAVTWMALCGTATPSQAVSGKTGRERGPARG